MVQIKVASKLLCIQKTDQIKSENRTGKLRPPSPRCQDGKNKGTEMKRSKSMNPSTIQSSLKSPNFIKQVPQPGKPPPDEKPKQSPNYMKSTCSFEARKEQSQVNSRAPVKSPKKDLKSSEPSPNSVHIPAKTLTRTSSLKRVTTLTKTPSFKPTGAANKKSSQVVRCEDLNSQRATCSSTLKDSKFPTYLELCRGSTESEGTSLSKVCPYTYCSLNGHNHAPLPPLKSFLSAKRCMLKTQKNKKLGSLSPRKMEPSGDLEQEILGKMAVEEKAAIQEPRVQEDHMDFYIELYVENRENDCKIGSGKNGNGDVDGLSNEAPNSRNDFESNFGDCCEIMKTDALFFPQEEQMGEKDKEVNSLKSNQEEETQETVSNQGRMEHNETDSETYYVEWEEGQHPAEDKGGYVSENSSTSGDNPSFHNENIFGISYFDEILVDEGEELFVQSGDDKTKYINNYDKVSIEPIEDKESSTLLVNLRKYSGEAQQDKIHEYYETSENTTQFFELDDRYEDVIVGDFLADTKNAETSQNLEHEMEDKKQDNVNESLIGVQANLSTTDRESKDAFDDKCPCVNQINTDTDPCQAEIFKSLDSIDSEDQTHSELNKAIIADEIISDMDAVEMAYSDDTNDNESSSAEKDGTQKRAKTAHTHGGVHSSGVLQNDTINLQITKGENSEDDLVKERGFNPREPNYLPLTPDPESEKVDLRHQDLDDKKNAEEWMIDYALQQTVTRLAPARNRKVALLVEAFEKVMPPQYEPRLKHTSASFAPVRSIQACS